MVRRRNCPPGQESGHLEGEFSHVASPVHTTHSTLTLTHIPTEVVVIQGVVNLQSGLFPCSKIPKILTNIRCSGQKKNLLLFSAKMAILSHAAYDQLVINMSHGSFSSQGAGNDFLARFCLRSLFEIDTSYIWRQFRTTLLGFRPSTNCFQFHL